MVSVFIDDYSANFFEDDGERWNLRKIFQSEGEEVDDSGVFEEEELEEEDSIEDEEGDDIIMAIKR